MYVSQLFSLTLFICLHMYTHHITQRASSLVVDLQRTAKCFKVADIKKMICSKINQNVFPGLIDAHVVV